MDEREDLRFGVTLATDRHPGQSAAEVLARTVEVARRAEELGLDDVWVTEHHFLDTAVNPSALTLAAYLLAMTETLHVGTAVTVLPLHSPVHTAEQAALLGQLSGGRFSLGVGRGFPGVEYDVLGPGLAAWRAGLAGPLDRLLGARAARCPRTRPCVRSASHLPCTPRQALRCTWRPAPPRR